MTQPPPNPTNSLAADLQVEPGTKVCFLWMYNDECLVSNHATVWNDEHVAWEDVSAKDCVLNNVSATSSEPQCQVVTGNTNEIIASTSIALHTIFENPQPRRLVLAMSPQGSLTVVVNAERNEGQMSEGQKFFEETPTQKLSRSLRALGDSSGCEYTDPEPASSPSAPTMTPVELFEALEMGSPLEYGVQPVDDDDKDTNRLNLTHDIGIIDDDQAPCCLEEQFQHCSETATTTEDCIGTNGSKGGSEASSLESLQRKCWRLAKERDQARAESFEQASIAVQRGIEIENLKRSRDMLLQRLETTEMQLMLLVPKFDTAHGKGALTPAQAEVADFSLPHKAPASNQSLQEEDSTVSALIEAKSTLAEKEYEIMGLLGQLRVKDSHIKALKEYLAASSHSAAKWATEQDGVIPFPLNSFTPAKLRDVNPAAGGNAGEKKGRVVHIHAHAHAHAMHS